MSAKAKTVNLDQETSPHDLPEDAAVAESALDVVPAGIVQLLSVRPVHCK
ncbi:MAG: hypothetical protein AAF399_28640 [Bacteroidota bacterium]